jgi:hypothetical protein
MELIMGESNNSFRLNLEETVPTYTIGAAFTLSVVMGIIVVSGVLLKPYEAREVVASLHERVMMEKENRELRRIKYTVHKTAFSKAEHSDFLESNVVPEPYYSTIIPEATVDTLTAKLSSEKTDRAQDFDRSVKSDEYWNNLQASITGLEPMLPGSIPVVLPAVVVGSAD